MGRMKTTWTLLLALLLSTIPAAAGGMLKSGDQFPPWALVDHTGAKVPSKDYAGKTYLVWYYVKAMTPG